MYSWSLAVWERAKSGLWLVPSLFIVLAAGLAAVSVRIRLPGWSGDNGNVLWWFHDGSARDASNLLHTLLTSMITMTTLVVSITMVVLTVAANVMGPRLIRRFMADLRTQSFLGLYLGTTIYVGLVIRGVGSGTGPQDVPHLAVTMASTFALVCVLALLLYVHYLARSIVTDAVVERVGADLDEAIARLLPEHDHHDPELLPMLRFEPAVYSVDQGGYLQVVDYSGLAEAASEADALVVADVRPGDYLIPGGCHMRIYPAGAASDTFMRHIRRHLAIGRDRTPPQDLEFGIRQLVEIALRALSPSINDPYTALAVIDRLSVSLARIMKRAPDRVVIYDDDGEPRILLRTRSFDELMATAFDQIRHAGRQRPDILRHLLDVLSRLAIHIREESHRHVLLVHADAIIEHGRKHFEIERDSAMIEASYETARQVLEGKCFPFDEPTGRLRQQKEASVRAIRHSSS